MEKCKKTELTKERIIDSALKEFGINGYDAVTLNSVCARYNISKGLFYHNFKGKDEVYLVCVEKCFTELTDYLKSNVEINNINLEEKLKAYFSARLSFFHSNPLYQRIFCDAVIFPPPHLQSEIKEIKLDFDNYNIEVIESLISNLNLRNGVSKTDVIEIFQQHQDFINAKYQLSGISESDFKSHEKNCHRAIDILLYGVIERV